jgi:hypothetical protein
MARITTPRAQPRKGFLLLASGTLWVFQPRVDAQTPNTRIGTTVPSVVPSPFVTRERAAAPRRVRVVPGLSRVVSRSYRASSVRRAQ